MSAHFDEVERNRQRAGKCAHLKVGDKVRTDYSGRITEHEIVDTDRWKPSQSGILFKVKPHVPKSSGSWMDAGWFEPVDMNAAS